MVHHVARIERTSYRKCPYECSEAADLKFLKLPHLVSFHVQMQWPKYHLPPMALNRGKYLGIISRAEVSLTNLILPGQFLKKALMRTANSNGPNFAP